MIKVKASEVIVWAADIGSIKNKRFGWCRAHHTSGVNVLIGQGKDIHAFVSGITADLEAGYSVAVGFECPLFVPVTSEPVNLTSARKGEGNRAWSAGAGSGSLATGLPICVWVFEQLKQLSSLAIQPTFDWNVFQNRQANLFVWEAFVTAEAKTTVISANKHHFDAEIAVRSFWDAYPQIIDANAVSAENPYSLVGAALIRSGLTSDLSFLSEACVVIRSK